MSEGIEVPQFCASFAQQIAAEQPQIVLIGPVCADNKGRPAFVMIFGSTGHDPNTLECAGDRPGQAGVYRAGIVAALMGCTWASLHVFTDEMPMVQFASGLWPGHYAAVAAEMEVTQAGGGHA